MSEPDLPGQGIVRVAYTPADQPDATVIAPGHVVAAHAPTPAARAAAMAQCTRLGAPADWRTVNAYRLPAPVERAIRATGTGSLHVWAWAPSHAQHPGHTGEPFLSYWMPNARLLPGTHPGGALALALEPGPVFMLPYLAHLPADERPHALWNPDDRQVVWPVGALPACTHPQQEQ
jgi:hypothetical protein